MKCVICHSSNIADKVVGEAIWAGSNVVLVPFRVLVCNDCGERYYNRQAMQHLESIEASLRARTLTLEPVGQVLKLAGQSEPALTIHESHPDYNNTGPPEPSNTESPDAQG